MKRTCMILTLAAILALAVLCPVSALASADDVIYESYPSLNENGQVDTQHYCADFNKDIVITFADLQQKYGRLELASFMLKDENNKKEDVLASWKDYNWNFGRDFEVYKNDKGEIDQSFFVRKDALEPADSIDETYEVSYHIIRVALEKFEYLSLVFYVGDDLDEMEPIWKGDIYGTSSTGDTVNIKKLTLNRAHDGSAAQNADEAADVPALVAATTGSNETAAVDSSLPAESAAPDKDAEQDSQKAAADAEQENQKTAADAEPENQAIAQDEVRKDQPSVKDEEITEAAEPLSLRLCGETGDPIELVTEDDEGRLQAAGAEAIKQLIPGEYSFVLEGGTSDDKLICTLPDPDNSENNSAFPVQAGNNNRDVQIEAGKSCRLTVKRGKEEKVELELVGLITKEITIDEPRFENGKQNGRVDFVNSNDLDVCINIDKLNDGERLVFTGTAEAGKTLKWKLVKADNDDQSGLVSCDENGAQSGSVSCDENGDWSVSVDLGNIELGADVKNAITDLGNKNAFKDYEGKLEFSICYEEDKAKMNYAGTEETSEPGKASCTVKIDTKAPEGYIEFAYGEEALEPKDGSPAIFAERDDCRLEVRYGEVVNGQRAEQVSTWTRGSDDVPELRVVNDHGLTSITYTLSDEAGNEVQLTASARIVRPIAISGQTVDGVALETGEWIGADQRDAKIVLQGAAEPGEEIVGTLCVSDPADGSAPTEQTACAEDGAWQLEFALPAELPEEGKLWIEIRYQDEKLHAVLGSVASQTWNFDFQAPEAPQMTIDGEETDGGEIPTFVAGEEITLLAVPQEDGATLASLTMSPDGGEAVDVTAEAQDGKYSFAAQSGRYAFAATVRDPAGNESAATELEMLVVDRVTVNGSFEEDALLNDAQLRDGGLVFEIQADAKRDDLAFECLLDGEATDGLGVLRGEKGSWQLSIAYENLKKQNLNENAPVSLDLNVFYSELNRDAFCGSWKGSFDLWTPAVKIGAIATYGRNDGQYFGGERILVKVLTSGDVQLAVESDQGQIEAIDEAAFEDSVAGGSMVKTYVTSEAGFTGQYYALNSADSASMEISASVVDEAGNSAEDALALKRYDTTKQMKDNVTISGVITRREDARVTVKGKGAIPMYRLSIVDSASGKEIRQIGVENNGDWTLELSMENLPKGFEGDAWELIARYPDEFYNANVKPCTFSIPVDISCKLEWEEPREGDTSIAVQTEPGAELTLYLDGSEIGKMSADQDGAAVFELESRIAMDAKIAVRAVDDNGNESEISNANGVSEAAEHAPLEITEIQQKDARTIIASGTGEPGLTVTGPAADGKAAPAATVDGDGRFTIELEVDEKAMSVYLVLNYQDIYADERAERAFKMDRTAPMLSISPEVVSDVGGEVTVSTEAGAAVCFVNGNKKVANAKAESEEVSVMLPKLDGLSVIEAYAVDECGNRSASVYLTVEASPRLMAGFDQPADQAVLDSEGRTVLSGWIAASNGGDPKELVLSIAQGDIRKELRLGGTAVTLVEDDARLNEDANLQELSGQMNVGHCWSFAYEMPLGEWEKGEFEIRLIHDQETLSTRSFSSGVDAGRRLRYIVLCALALAACLIFLILALIFSKRIRRLSDGRINPNSGMSKLTERSRQQPKQ